jgi:NAD(P) transhydrogenase subunit alpha
MRPGSIIVDLGADGGGNCEASRPGESVLLNGVRIIAPLNLPASLPTHASLLFARNLTSFIQTFTKDKSFVLDLTDDIQKASIITREGEILHARTREALQGVGR